MHKDLSELYLNFQDITFGEQSGNIGFTSNIFHLITRSKVEDFEASSSSLIYFKNNNNGYILSRNYNGV